MKNFPDIGLQIPQIYLPKPGTDLAKWAVIACDQYTSQPDYWQKVESTVGDVPSALKLILPEIFLERQDVPERIANVQATMSRYLDQGTLIPNEGMIYIERTVGGRTRRGIMAALDLERYDYTVGSTSLIRATEGTIVDRLPPRIRIREHAPLELPHILVLIDDADNSVIGPVNDHKADMEKVYDFDLMMDSGHLTGYRINQPVLEEKIVSTLRALAHPKVQSAKYDVAPGAPPLLFAMGDGNHSLATAKAIWEKVKLKVGMDHPSRYALVEIENVHDTALSFEPIHRVLFGLKQDLLALIGDDVQFTQVRSAEAMIRQVDEQIAGRQCAGLVNGANGFGVLEITRPTSNLTVGTLQPVLDRFLSQGGVEKMDYVHGAETMLRLGSQPGNMGLYFPGMKKTDLFKTVILDGTLPRKTFSMGEAHEKRFYMEARKIT